MLGRCRYVDRYCYLYASLKQQRCFSRTVASSLFLGPLDHWTIDVSRVHGVPCVFCVLYPPASRQLASLVSLVSRFLGKRRSTSITKFVSIARLVEDIRSVRREERSFVHHDYSVYWDAIGRPGSHSAWSSIHGARGRFACVFHHGGHFQGKVQT